jgi:hypothetical protein
MTAALKRYWNTGTRWCALYYEDGTLELALWPCESTDRAFELAVVWREAPPRWPPS